MKFLFVGGIVNGRLLEVAPLNPLSMTYPETFRVRINYLELPFQNGTKVVEIQDQQYYRADFYSGKQAIHVYTAGNPENIIYDLISGYAQLYNELVNIRDN